jgi:hypothetical protein
VWAQAVDATPSGIKLFSKVVFMTQEKRFGLSAAQKDLYSLQLAHGLFGDIIPVQNGHQPTGIYQNNGISFRWPGPQEELRPCDGHPER